MHDSPPSSAHAFRTAFLQLARPSQASRWDDTQCGWGRLRSWASRMSSPSAMCVLGPDPFILSQSLHPSTSAFEAMRAHHACLLALPALHLSIQGVGTCAHLHTSTRAHRHACRHACTHARTHVMHAPSSPVCPSLSHLQTNCAMPPTPLAPLLHTHAAAPSRCVSGRATPSSCSSSCSRRAAQKQLPSAAPTAGYSWATCRAARWWPSM